jgi:hypothetical protein
VKDDGSGGWTFTTLASGRRALTAVGTGGAKTLVAEYHVPHRIKLGQVDGQIHYHLHLDFSDQNAGDAVITVHFYAAKRDGTYGGPFTLTYTLTPANLALNSNLVFELALPTGMAAYMDVDALIEAIITRDPSLPADTYAGSVYFGTADFHVLEDGRPTTAKDEGTGWVKA